MLKRRLLSTMAAAMAAVTMMANPVGAATMDSMLVVGDSITTGYGLAGYQAGDNSSAADSFANLLAKQYSLTNGTTSKNLGVDGITSSDLVKSFSNAEQAAVLQTALTNTDTLILSVGGNDVLHPLIQAIGTGLQSQATVLGALGVTVDVSSNSAILATLSAALQADKTGTVLTQLQNVVAGDASQQAFTSAVETFTTNISTILTTIYAINPEVKVYVLNIYNPFSGVAGFEVLSNTTDTILNNMNAALHLVEAKTATNNCSLKVVDIASVMKGRAGLYTNIASLDIHPNKAGHQLIETAVVADIAKTDLPVIAPIATATPQPSVPAEPTPTPIAVIPYWITTTTPQPATAQPTPAATATATANVPVTTSSGSAAKTGDEANIAGLIVIALFSTTLLLGGVKKRVQE